MCGHLVAGLAGYPMLGYEHLLHHARFGDTAMAEWPRVKESVWSFAARRLGRIVRDTLAPGVVLWLRQSAGFGGAKRLRCAVAVSLVTLAAFAAAGGWAGVAIYLGASFGVAFGIQVMTYIQHWGLGDDNLPDGGDRQYAWEDDCRFQAWLTLSISFHQAHHHASRVPFYRLTLEQGSPRQPAGYVVLMLISFVPGVWRPVMAAVLAEWRRNPGEMRSAGRGLTCFSVLRVGVEKRTSA
jgi:alkane 1-monooxygenase